MCFNAALTKKQRDLAEGLGLPEDAVPSLKPVYNVSGFAHPELPLLLRDGGSVTVTLALWGLIPFWARDEAQIRTLRNQTLNARAETLRSRPSYRHLVDGNRCLVVVDGFFEPHRHNGTTYPFFCSLPDRALMTLAGLYSERDGVKTFTVITVPATGLMAEVHNEKLRMPRIVRPEQRDSWLDPELAGDAVIRFLVDNPEEPALRAWPVSRAVYGRGAVSSDPSLLESVEYPSLQSAITTGKSENREV